MYGCPSRGGGGRFSNSQWLRDGVRSLNRRWKRRGRSESGSEVLPHRVEVRDGVPIVVREVVFARGIRRHRAVPVFFHASHSVKTRLVAFVLLLLSKG